MAKFIYNVKLLNQAELARLSGYTPSYVNQLIKGRKKSKKAIDVINQVIKSNLILLK